MKDRLEKAAFSGTAERKPRSKKEQGSRLQSVNRLLTAG